jgi:hypothetical protein
MTREGEAVMRTSGILKPVGGIDPKVGAERYAD